MKKQGFTLIELLTTIAILSIIVAIATPIVLKTIENAEKNTFKNSIYGLLKAGRNEYMLNKVDGEDNDLEYKYENGKLITDRDLDYTGASPSGGKMVIRKDGKILIAVHNDKWCATKKYNSNELVINKYTDTGSCQLPDIPNAPALVSGMTPIKWNGSDWVNTTEDDLDWYDYENKKWANAKTADGSFWVWIPRYAYSIISNYHTDTAGDIEIKFLKYKTNFTVDDTAVATNPTYSGSNQTNYVKHPAFKFGNVELEGIWVAKFEASAPEGSSCYSSSSITNCDITNLKPRVVANVSSWRNITIGNAFAVCKDMENNKDLYGWEPESVNTHMMKITEWGAVAYLSKSKYGKYNDEIWVNNSSTYITGCAGNSVSASEYIGCQNQYNTSFGQQASTTGNVYGIYDMSGGSYERVAAYINNGHSNLTTYGSSILYAIPQYKDLYEVGVTDTREENYYKNSNKFGAIVYETSDYYGGSYSWYDDYSYMPRVENAWFLLGGGYYDGSSAGIFSFHYTVGRAYSEYGFRPVVVPILYNK